MMQTASKRLRIVPRQEPAPHCEPDVPDAARPFLDAIAELLAAAVLRDRHEPQGRPADHRLIWARAANRMHGR